MRVPTVAIGKILTADVKVMRKPITATQLFAGRQEFGPAVCFYCCGECEEKNPASEIVKSSFTGLDTVTLSQWVCDGCLAAMQEKATIGLIDGDARAGQKVRGYSWVITQDARYAATKAHRERLLAVCDEPPEPPFVICLTDSGQKHLLYRAVVNASRDVVTVSLELELVTYRPSELVERLELCKRVCAATGKPAMQSSMSPQSLMRIVEHYESEEILAAWLGCCNESLTRLATWLCPAKAECEVEYPRVT
jgi:CRISPR type IV-associated protein Csf1